MAVRDRARSDHYLAQLRSQSAPNTPGGPLSPRDGGWRAPQDSQPAVTTFAEPQPFTLMPAPSKAKPAAKTGSADGDVSPVSPMVEVRQVHAPVAQGETSYGQVSIPGAYAGPASPGLPVTQQPQQGAFDFGLGRR